MNYNRIVGSAYSWVSLKKAVWFLIFFWVALPVVVLLPNFSSAYPIFSPEFTLIVYALYAVMYIALIAGFVVLTQQCLIDKRLGAEKLSLLGIVDVVLLVFAEFFYVFLWNLHKPFRAIQALVLLCCALLFYYFSLVRTVDALNLFGLCATAYFILVIYNCVRVFFSTTIYCNHDGGIKSSIKEAWALTHEKFYEAFTGIAASVVIAAFLFFFIMIMLGTLSSLVLSYFFIHPLAVEFGFYAAAMFALAPAIIAYHYSIAEVFSQLSAHHSLSSKIKGVLAHHILHPAKAVAKRKLAKKKKRK